MSACNSLRLHCLEAGHLHGSCRSDHGRPASVVAVLDSPCAVPTQTTDVLHTVMHSRNCMAVHALLQNDAACSMQTQPASLRSKVLAATCESCTVALSRFWKGLVSGVQSRSSCKSVSGADAGACFQGFMGCSTCLDATGLQHAVFHILRRCIISGVQTECTACVSVAGVFRCHPFF